MSGTNTELAEAPSPEPANAAATAALQRAERSALPLLEHVEELRRRLWVCLGAISLAAMVSFASAGQLMEWLKRPAGPALAKLAFFSPPEGMLAYMKVAIAAGLALAMPVVLYELWAFVSPGLSRQERRYGRHFIVWGSLLFLGGCAFAYWVLLPISLKFLLAFGGGQLEPIISVGRYLSFTLGVLLACGLVFQLPLAVALLTKIGVLRARTLRRKWPHAAVGLAIIAAILTPTTDIATMLLMVIPMLALYEVSIWVAALIERGRRLP
jgi:sec-independent protein translocase protein TatC